MEGGSLSKKNKTKKSPGFSVIEILVVLAVLMIVSGLIVPGFNFFRKQSSLNAATQEIINTLRLAQNKTLASEGNSSFGVYLESDKFILFKGTAYSASSSNNEAHNLDSSLRISTLSLNGSNSVVFERLTGNTVNYGAITLEQIDDISQNKVIFIDSSGSVSLASSSANDASREKDTRHVEFLYGQNVKTASTLSLAFPESGTTNNIAFGDYLNSGQTQFSWEGTVVVAGENQELKIHTHSLTDTSVLFCVHRDRQKNTAALNISLDGQNLINFAANGEITQGTSPWVASPQAK